MKEEGRTGLPQGVSGNPENVDSPEWHEFVLNADRARKAALRLVLKNANKGGEGILKTVVATVRALEKMRSQRGRFWTTWSGACLR